jgi:hypothetical protein
LKLIYDRRSVGQSLFVSDSHLEPMTRFFFCVTLRVSWCRGSSLTRGWACNLLIHLLLGLAKAVTLGSKTRRTHGHILLSDMRLPQPGGPGPRIYFPQEQVSPVMPPDTGLPFRRLLRLTGIQTRLHTSLGRTNRLISYYTTRTASKTTSLTIQLWFLPSCYLATIRGCTNIPTDSPLIRQGQHPTIIPVLCVFYAAVRFYQPYA